MHKCITVYERATVQILTISNNTVHYFWCILLSFYIFTDCAECTNTCTSSDNIGAISSMAVLIGLLLIMLTSSIIINILLILKQK